MNKKATLFANIIKISLPVVAVAAMILCEYVTVGAEFKLNTQNITRIVLVAVSMLFVYLPLKDIFNNALNSGERAQGKLHDYAKCVDFVYNGNIEQLKAYCGEEYKRRRIKLIEDILRNTVMTVDEFTKKYAFDRSAVKNDKTLTKRERTAFLDVIREEKKIKPENIDTLLPSGKHHGAYRRVKSNSQRTNVLSIARRAFTSLVSAFALVSITFGFQDASAMVVATRAVMVIGLVCMYAFSAFMSATAINNEYCDELSEKTTFLIEFEEFVKKEGA